MEEEETLDVEGEEGEGHTLLCAECLSVSCDASPALHCLSPLTVVEDSAVERSLLLLQMRVEVMALQEKAAVEGFVLPQDRFWHPLADGLVLGELGQWTPFLCQVSQL